MKDLFRFIGEDGSMGYENGKIYLLHLKGQVMTIGQGYKVAIMTPQYCPYDSWEKFFENWERV